MRKVIRHPLATLVLGAALAVLIALLPVEASRQSDAAAFVTSLVPHRLAGCRRLAFSSYHVVFVRGGATIGDSWRPVDIDGSGDITLTLLHAARDCVHVGLLARTRESGFWAPMTRTETFRMEVAPVRGVDTVPEGGDRDQLKLAYAAFLRDQADREDDAAKLLQGEYERRSIVWVGVLHNIASIVVAMLWLRSLAWVRDVPRWWRQQQQSSMLGRKLCPSCRYSIEGLTTQTCPECGSPLPASPDAVTETQPASARA